MFRFGACVGNLMRRLLTVGTRISRDRACCYDYHDLGTVMLHYVVCARRTTHSCDKSTSPDHHSARSCLTSGIKSRTTNGETDLSMLSSCLIVTGLELVSQKCVKTSRSPPLQKRSGAF